VAGIAGITVERGGASCGVPLALREIQHRERALCLTRAAAALCFLFVLHFDSSLPGVHALAAYLSVFLYLTYTILILVLVRTSHDWGPRFLFLLHAADVLWPAVISLFTGGPESPFLVLFAVALAAAAVRWGLRETLGTALASVLVLLLETVFITSGWGRSFDLLQRQFRFSAFTLEILSILSLGGLLGYLAEKEEQFRCEVSTVKKMAQKADPETDISKTVQEALSDILRLFRANRATLVLRNPVTGASFIWTGSKAQEGRDAFQSGETSPSCMAGYFFPMPGQSWSLQKSRRGERYQLLALDTEGRRIEKASCCLPANLFSENQFRTMMAATFALGSEWCGRCFLFDLQNSAPTPADLRFFQEVVREVAPAVYSAHLLRRAQSRVRAVERARLARDLHDGVVQSLVALEMQVDALRREAVGMSSEAAEKLEHVRGLLRDEVINLRELTQQLQLDDVTPQQLEAHLAAMLDKFQRETGIRASFTPDFDASAFSPRVSREVAHIVYEALTNVRKHGQACSVHVQLQSEDALWKLVIEDDGKGFEFSGRLSQADLDAAGKGPQVIKQRVRAIKGDLAIESDPDRGARLEIRFAPKGYG
jgi:signal transduction histidine kinase